MMGLTVNYTAIFVSGILLMVLGYLWYGPVFGKPWMKLMGISKSSMQGKGGEMAKNYGLMFLASLILSYVFAYVLAAFQISSVTGAVMGAFWTWLGFIATTMLGGVLWTKKPVKLYLIDSGYYLVGLAIISVVLTLWR